MAEKDKPSDQPQMLLEITVAIQDPVKKAWWWILVNGLPLRNGVGV